MVKSRFRKGAGLLGIAAVTTAVAALGGGIPSPVSADPIAKTAYVGVGSDTIQDVFNALSGAAPYSPGGGTVKGYDPIISSTASGNRGVVSWDAFDAATPAVTCITPKYNFGVIDRPNGSGDGQKALSRAIDGGLWTKGTGCSTTVGNATGAIDFARSSSGPNGSFPGTTLTFIPFARDGLSYAYVAHAGADLSALTTAELHSLFGTGNLASSGTIPNFRSTGHAVFACMVQGGSGTGKFWDKAMGNAGDGATSHASAVAGGCNASVDYEENGYNTWSASTFVAGLSATQDAVIPFSVGSWISQANGVAVDRSATGRSSGDKLGAVDGVAPTTGSAPTEAPNATYYASTTYGRDLYVVVATSKVPSIGGDAGLKSLFRGATSEICKAPAQATINKFGFSSVTAKPCGTTGDATLQSGLVS